MTTSVCPECNNPDYTRSPGETGGRACTECKQEWWPDVDYALMKDRAVKYNKGKLRWSLIPWRCMVIIVKVFEAGLHEGTDKERKVDDWKKGAPWMEYWDAIIRHMTAWQMGEDNDPDTGLPHMAHVGAGTLILLWYIITGKGKDDRKT